MKNSLYIFIILLAKTSLAQTACYTASNSISFNYNGHSYKIIKELKTWANAATCAVSDGGYLVEINDAAEQTAVYNALTTSGISTTYHAVNDGGGTSYIWIGATDKNTEGTWLWDGNNDNVGTNFWYGQGQAQGGTGNIVGGLYNNWGQTNGTGPNNEPDDYIAIQDAGAIALAGWPSGGSSYGAPGQWNDINPTNTIYYIIEYNTLSTSLNEYEPKNKSNVFPNPVSNQLTIAGNYTHITLQTTDGKIIEAPQQKTTTATTLDIKALPNGVYFLNCIDANKKTSTQKIIVTNL